MAQIGSFPGSCEIVEIDDNDDELFISEHSTRVNHSSSKMRTEERDRRSLGLNLDRISGLEDDLNQLFEIFNRRASSHVLGNSRLTGAGHSRVNSSKNILGASSGSSPRPGISDRANLKQALRGLCISQASEMAAMRRSAKLGRPSEAGKIASMYRSVLLEETKSVASQQTIAVNHTVSVISSMQGGKIPYSGDRGRSMETPSSSSPSVAPLSPPQPQPASSSSTAIDSSRQARKEEEHSSPPSSNSSPPPDQSVKQRSTEKVASGLKANKPARSASYFVKPVIKTRSHVRRKTKKGVVHQGHSQIVCPRCQCIVSDDAREEAKAKAKRVSSGAQVNNTSNAAVSDAGTPCFTSDSSGKSKEDVVETKSSSKSSPSPGECSSSTTSMSEESNLTTRPSCCDRPHMSKDVRWEAIRRIKAAQHGAALSLRHFNLLKKLGCGDIGTVYLAELMGTDCLFAIKVMDNEFLVRRKKMSRAQTEREILRMLDHPFLPTLYSQFTSDNLSCLVMEYCPGGDLHVLRQKQCGRCFTEQAARFYVAEVLLALEYLHMLGVVYRDLKPENILVRDDGHIMLSDFDLSLRCAVNPMLLVSSSSSSSSSVADTTKRVSGPCADSGCAQPFCVEPSCQVSCFSPGTRPRKLKPGGPSEPVRGPLPVLVAEPTMARSNSFVGTHEYLAPEIIKGEGHGSAVDWWTFGIFLYELLYGRTPFKGSGNDETLANVVLDTLKFPDSPLVSFHARDLITGLLVKDPENRLGTERGAAEIKQHPFFDGLNWALIRCASPPQLPESRNFGFGNAKDPSLDNNNNKGNDMYFECKAPATATKGEHLEFEVF